MLEVKNTRVAFLGSAIKSAHNAYSVGEINTTWDEIDFLTEDKFKDINDSVFLKEAVKNEVKSIQFLGSNGNHQPNQSHNHFLSLITVRADLKYPRYISCEFQRYHWFEICSSQSTMHCLTMAMKDDDCSKFFNAHTNQQSVDYLRHKVNEYNTLVEQNKTETDDNVRMARSVEIERLFHEIKSNLVEGYELWLTFGTNYLQLATMLVQRHNHRLNDWKPFCDWIHGLPLFDYLTDLGECKTRG